VQFGVAPVQLVPLVSREFAERGVGVSLGLATQPFDHGSQLCERHAHGTRQVSQRLAQSPIARRAEDGCCDEPLGLPQQVVIAFKAEHPPCDFLRVDSHGEVTKGLGERESIAESPSHKVAESEIAIVSYLALAGEKRLSLSNTH